MGDPPPPNRFLFESVHEVIDTIFAIAKETGKLPIHVVVGLCYQEYPTSLLDFVHISMECKK